MAFTELELSCPIKTDWTLFILTGQYSACSNVHRRALRHKKNPKSLNFGRPSCPVRQINSYLSNICTKVNHLTTENEQFELVAISQNLSLGQRMKKERTEELFQHINSFVEKECPELSVTQLLEYLIHLNNKRLI